jgi:hypothetical protein
MTGVLRWHYVVGSRAIAIRMEYYPESIEPVVAHQRDEHLRKSKIFETKYGGRIFLTFIYNQQAFQLAFHFNILF